jgi:PIN domain nuclease of toxin-antitoxin system
LPSADAKPTVSKYVLDSSAVLAVLQNEPGKELVMAALPGAFVFSVNLAEVASKLSDRGIPAEMANATLATLRLNVVAFTQEQALLSGNLRARTRGRGLSLGDRACLALATELGLAALTTDSVRVVATDVKVVSIR